MKYIIKSAVLGLILCMSQGLFSQDRFERLYTTTDTDVLSSSLHEMGGDYLILSLQINEDGENEFINLSKLDQKGNIDWSKEYEYDEEDMFISELGEVELLADGNIAFTAFIQKDSLNKLITKVDPNGNVFWTRLTGREEDKLTNGYRSNLVSMEDMGILHISTLVTDNMTEVFLSSVSLSGDLEWGSTWEVQDTTGSLLAANVRDAIFLQDSNILLLGNTMDEKHQLFLTKMDTTGAIIWSKSYTADLGTGLSQSAISLDEMIDSTIIILAAQAGGSSNGLLLNVDQEGNYIQSRSIESITNGIDIIPVGVTGLGDSTMAIALKRLDLLSSELRPVLVKFDMDSTVFYQTLLKSSTDIDPTRGGLISPDSISPVFLTSSTRVDSIRLNPYITKLDEFGNTNCNDEVNFLRFDSIFFAVDTLVWTSSEQESFDSIEVFVRNFSEFNPPLLTLADTLFCPQDPVLFTLDATTRGAVSYLWEDGSVDPIRTVTETGMFTVTVTVGIEECFTLCDTASVSQNEFPTAMIEVNTANFCSTGELILSVSSNNSIVSTLWSTGESTLDIIVTDLAQYTVNIVDDCDNPAQASVDLRDFEIINNPTVSVSGENLCDDNSLLLVAGGAVNVEDLMWSTGEVGVASISVTSPGNYTVDNVAQFCPGSTTVEIIEDQFLTPLSIGITDQCNQASNAIQLVAGGTGNIQSLSWSTGSTQSLINITEVGTYTVTATDICGDTQDASITITQEQIDECITTTPPPTGTDCLEWPNAIYPASNNDLNRSFGPEDMNCGNATIDSYNLRIYNRWGNMIFESDNINTRWNGLKNNSGGELPATTYFWYSSYNINDEAFENEGDVTIIR